MESVVPLACLLIITCSPFLPSYRLSGKQSQAARLLLTSISSILGPTHALATVRTVSSSTQRLATSPPARHRHAGRHDVDGHRGFHGGGGRRRGSGGGGGAPQPVWRAARRLAVRAV